MKKRERKVTFRDWGEKDTAEYDSRDTTQKRRTIFDWFLLGSVSLWWVFLSWRPRIAEGILSHLD
jgi:hypothetical protein